MIAPNDDPILHVKDENDLRALLEKEKDTEEYNRLIKSPYASAKVVLYHKFGVGDCNCSMCEGDYQYQKGEPTS